MSIPNPDKPELTNCKHHLIFKNGPNKFQITISNSYIRSRTNCLVFVICYFLIAETPGPDRTLYKPMR